jgi:hypothetical protein
MIFVTIPFCTFRTGMGLSILLFVLFHGMHLLCLNFAPLLFSPT